MSYQALYRVFRSNTFEELIGQEYIIRTLTNQIKSGQIGHAYLFCGPRGTGKTSTARIFARAINCINNTTGSPCCTCSVCKSLADGSSLDIVEIDAASNNGVDSIRDLREKILYPPVSCKYKVYIIDEAHMLSDSAFNALLKTLEEPPVHAVIILATTEPNKIPATVLSRCMRFDFRLFTREEIEGHLKHVLKTLGKAYEDKAVTALAIAAEGSMRDALSIADMCVSYSADKLTYTGVTDLLGIADFDELSALCNAILRTHIKVAVSKIDVLLSNGKSVGVLVRDVIGYFNNCAIANACGKASDALNLPQDMCDVIDTSVTFGDEHTFIRLIDIFAQLENDLRYSTSQRVLFETAVLRAMLPVADYDIEALLSRMAGLERQLARIKSMPQAPQQAPQIAVTAPSDSVALTNNGEVQIKAEPKKSEKKSAPLKAEKIISDRELAGLTLPEDEVAELPSLDALDEKVAENVSHPTENLQHLQAEFMRCLRLSKNMVAVTLGQNITFAQDGNTVVLVAENDSIYKSAQREINYQSIVNALKAVGVDDFRLECKNEKKPQNAAKLAIDSIKNDFSGFNVTIKKNNK